MNVKLIASLILAAVAILFMLQNLAVVEIRFLLWSFGMSRALFMLLMLVIGFGAGWSAHGYLAHRRKAMSP